MLGRAWARAERALNQTLKSEAGPPFCCVFSTQSQFLTIPAAFEKSTYPGLLFLHFARDPRADSYPMLVSYWASEASFAAARARLTKELSLGALTSSGLVSDLRTGKRTLYQSLRRLSLREVLIGVSAIVSALVLLINFAGDAFSYLFAAPRIDVVQPHKDIDVVEEAQLLLPLKVRSRLASRNIELETDASDPLRLEAADPPESPQVPRARRPPLRLAVEGGRPPLLPAGQTVELNLRLALGELPVPQPIVLPNVDVADPRPAQLQLKGRLLATRDGWIWRPLQYEMPSIRVRLWSKIRCTRTVELASQLGSGAASKVAFTGRLYAGEPRDTARVYVEGIGIRSADMSAMDGDRLISQEQSFDGSVKVLEWTRSVRAFTVNTFAVILESKEPYPATHWQKLREGITIDCR